MGPAPARSMEPPQARGDPAIGRPWRWQRLRLCPRLLQLQLLLLLLLRGCSGVAGALPPGCKHDGRPRGGGRPATGGPAEGKVVCSSLELARVLPPDLLPNRTVTL